MKFFLRRAARTDANAIRRLVWRVKINPLGLDWRRFWVVVDENDRLIGCGQVKQHGDGSREMASIAVEPAHQRQGIGRAIIERILAEHEAASTAQPGPQSWEIPSPLYLTCRPGMHVYYRQFGFMTLDESELPPYFQRIYQAADWLKTLFPRMDTPIVMVRGGRTRV